jgi:hypothetical protein
LRSCSNYYQSVALFLSPICWIMKKQGRTNLVQLINRHHIILLSGKDTDWDRIDILQIGLDEERGMESNSDISLDW